MKEYRQDSHTGPLVVWAVLCLLTALFLFAHAGRIVDRMLRTEEVLLAVGLLIVGPMGLATYLYRARHVWVSVVSDGLLVSGKHLVPWEDIVRVERRPPRLRSTSGPPRVPEGVAWPVDDGGCLLELGAVGVAVGVLLLALAVLWAIVAIVVPLLFIPVLEIYAPFGDRMRIHRRRGRPITLRDLRDADELLARLARRSP